jgi:hypothetical protein
VIPQVAIPRPYPAIILTPFPAFNIPLEQAEQVFGPDV